MALSPGPTGPAGPEAAWAASASASAHLFVEGLADTLNLDDANAHHLARVLRLRPGEVVTAADAGAWRRYRVGAVAGTEVRLDADGPVAVEPVLRPALAVAFALTKADKPELVVQKLTELGVDRILPVLAARSVVRPDPARAAAAVARWRRIAAEAARQCRRCRLPEVAEVAPLGALAGHPAVVVAERGGGPVDDLDAPPGGELLAVVGPEGGFGPGETDALDPWARVGLGPYVLRAETAAVAVAVTLAVHRCVSDDRHSAWLE
jgi:16S rRNA (uracil1498-N3)-methyltransferase